MINPRLVGYLGIIVALGAVFTYLEPRFLSEGNIRAILRHLSTSSFAALGVTFVIVVRKFDLSITGTISFIAMTIGFVIAQGGDLYLALACGLVAGVSIGALNGILVSYLRFSDIVATIATGCVFGGLAFVFSGGQTIFQNFFQSGILDINDTRILGINLPTYFLLGAAIVLWLVLHASRTGNALFATGANPAAAWLAGVDARFATFLTFVVSGATMTACAALFVAETGRAVPTAGIGFLMPTYAAIFIGSAFFGAPSILATLSGTLLMTLVLNGFTLLSVPYYWSDAVVSLIMLVSMILFRRGLLEAVLAAAAIFSASSRKESVK